MRRLLPLLALGIAACSTSPTPPPITTPDPVVAPPPRTGLSGLNQAELQQRFGAPSFQVREGAGLKLQWQNGACVLDAYLYPPERGAGVATVLHADARRAGSGESLPLDGCLMSLGQR